MIVFRKPSRREARAGSRLLAKSGFEKITANMILDNDYPLAFNANGKVIGVFCCCVNRKKAHQKNHEKNFTA